MLEALARTLAPPWLTANNRVALLVVYVFVSTNGVPTVRYWQGLFRRVEEAERILFPNVSMVQ
jgi:hypothetical protein